MNLFNVILKTTRIRYRGSHPFRMITLGYLLLNPRLIDVNNKNKHVSTGTFYDVQNLLFSAFAVFALLRIARSKNNHIQVHNALVSFNIC